MTFNKNFITKLLKVLNQNINIVKIIKQNLINNYIYKMKIKYKKKLKKYNKNKKHNKNKNYQKINNYQKNN